MITFVNRHCSSQDLLPRSKLINILIRDSTRVYSNCFSRSYLESVDQPDANLSQHCRWNQARTSNMNKFVNIYRFITVKKMYVHTEHHQTWSFCTDFCRVALCNYLLQDTCLTIGRHWFSHVRPTTQISGIFLCFFLTLPPPPPKIILSKDVSGNNKRMLRKTNRCAAGPNQSSRSQSGVFTVYVHR